MDVPAAFLQRSRHYLGFEYPTKIRRCLDVLPADALWRRADAQSNSVGNLLLHLAGNARQWIVSGVGGARDARSRGAEFEAREGDDADSLFGALRATLDEVDAVLDGLACERLGDELLIQGLTVSVFDAVYHVVEHFSMHTGQIVLLTKVHASGRIHFYEDAGGLAIPRWEDGAPSSPRS